MHRERLGLLIGERGAWGRGHGSEAIRLASDYAFRELGVRKLTAGCYADNVGSATAFRRAGWREEGRRPRWTARSGPTRDDECAQRNQGRELSPQPRLPRSFPGREEASPEARDEFE